MRYAIRTFPQVSGNKSIAHRNSLRLLKLVNTLLDFSRLEAGRTQAIYEPTDLATLTADLASVFRSAIEKAGLEFIVNCQPLSEPVYVGLADNVEKANSVRILKLIHLVKCKKKGYNNPKPLHYHSSSVHLV